MKLFLKTRIDRCVLITPQTSDERIKAIDNASEGFIYMVSSASTTGAKQGFGAEQSDYFERIANMQLKTLKSLDLASVMQKLLDKRPKSQRCYHWFCLH